MGCNGFPLGSQYKSGKGFHNLCKDNFFNYLMINSYGSILAYNKGFIASRILMHWFSIVFRCKLHFILNDGCQWMSSHLRWCFNGLNFFYWDNSIEARILITIDILVDMIWLWMNSLTKLAILGYGYLWIATVHWILFERNRLTL